METTNEVPARNVWVVKGAGHSFDNAKEYGDIQMVLSEDVSPFNLDQARMQVKEAIKDSDEKDYIVVSGPSVLCMVFMEEWRKRHPVMRLLLFHARTQKYILREILFCL